MALSNQDQAQVRNYLLGHLNDEEQEKIEERLMIEDDLFEELEISKGELIEEYCADELPQKEREWFKDHYLASAEGIQRHVFTRALDSLKHCSVEPAPAPAPLAWVERIRRLFKSQPWGVAIAASTALVVIVAGLSLYRQAGAPPTFYAFNLSNTASRRSTGDTRYQKVPLSPNVDELRVSLQLPEGVARGTSYRAELDDRRQNTTLKETTHDANSVLVVIPAASLRPGLYALRLYAINDGAEQPVAGEYLFELVSPSQLPSAPQPQQSGNQ